MELPGLTVLKKRSDYLAAQRGKPVHKTGFTLRARERAPDGEMRVGFTCSKKVGNAVARNRAKRRLREIARLELPASGRAGWDYVLIGHRGTTATADFGELRAAFVDALDQLHGKER